MNPVTEEHETAFGRWLAPGPDGSKSEELIVSFDEGRVLRVLILPAWFDEANRMRRFTVEVMRRLHLSGIDSFLPDLPGCNESLTPLDQQTLAGWRHAAEAAASHVGATHVLTIRAGAMIAPDALPGWHYAPQTGPKLLRAMIRARTIFSREAGKAESSDELMALGRSDGVTLAGWPIGAEMFGELEAADATPSDRQRVIAQREIGGAGLWLRAEPDEDAAQADALTAIIAAEVG